MFRVDVSSSEPLFAQIVGAAKHAVATGRLRPGDRLPSVRELARELLINPNTIVRAYQALEAEGVTVSRRGSGTFVANRKVVVKTDERRRRFREALDPVLAQAVHLGLSEAEVRRAFTQTLKRFRFDGATKKGAKR
jgi:GntR family transcriptional regulator